MRMLVGLWLLGLTSCADPEDTSPSRATCVQLREHVVELRLAGLPASDAPLHRAALRDALGDRFVEQCQLLSGAEATCGLAATDSTSLAACSGTK